MCCVDSCYSFKKEGTLINHKPNNYDLNDKGPIPKLVIGVMVDVDMSPTKLIIIRREVCLQAKSPFGLSKDLGPKRHITFYGRRNQRK